MKDRPYYKTKLKRGPKPTTGIAWPFRINGNYIEQFDQRSKIWITPSGSPDRVGYIMLTWKAPNGRMYKRAHIVNWITHNGLIPEGLEIDHIDGNKANNSISNLRLVTHQQNIQYAIDRLGPWTPRKLDDGMLSLLLALPPKWRCLKELAALWGVSKFSLSNIRARAKRRKDPRYLACL